jgi:hypothetical protein
MITIDINNFKHSNLYGKDQLFTDILNILANNENNIYHIIDELFDIIKDNSKIYLKLRINLAKIWWNNLPLYNMNNPLSKIILSNQYYQKEPGLLSDSQILNIFEINFQLKEKLCKTIDNKISENEIEIIKNWWNDPNKSTLTDNDIILIYNLEHSINL